MKLYSVTRYRKQMYGEVPIVLPARTQRAAVSLARLLMGPGDWRASGPLDAGHVVDGVVRVRLPAGATFPDVAREFDRVWAVWEVIPA